MALLTPDQPANTNMPLVYISVLNWYNYEQTINCLHQLEKLDYEPRKIIVVDNASPNDSAACIRAEFPHLRLIQAKENLGYAAGHRHTVDAALAEGAELVWLVNTDITFEPNVLSTLVGAFLQFREAVYGSVLLQADKSTVGMRLYPIRDSGYPDLIHKIVKRGDEYARAFPDANPVPVADLYGCSFLIPTSVIRDHGFMDEKFFMYGEETAYCFMLNERGVPCYIVPRSIVLHAGGGSADHQPSLKVLLYNYYQFRNKLYIYRDYKGKQWYLRTILAVIRPRLMARVLRFVVMVHGGRQGVSGDYFRLMAIWDSLTDRMGKTFCPEDYIEGQRET